MDGINEFLKFIFNNATLPIYITGVLSYLIFYFKKKFDEKMYFNNILKEKLEEVYSPLRFYFKKYKSKEKICDTEIKDIIVNKSHLISDNILMDLNELIDTEEQKLAFHDKVKLKEYNFLRERIIERIEAEFKELREMYNKEFDNFKISGWEKFWRGLYAIGLIITIGTGIVLGIDWFAVYIFNESKVIDNIYINTIMFIYVLIILCTVIVFICKIFLEIAILLFQVFKKRKKFFTYERVPVTTKYKCSVCGNTEYFYKNGRFTKCKNHEELKTKMKSLFVFEPWRFCESEGSDDLSC